MLNESRTSITSLSELPYAKPAFDDHSGMSAVQAPVMYVTGSSETLEDYTPQTGNEQTYLQPNHSSVSLAGSQHSRASINDNALYPAANRGKRRQYSNSQEGLNGHVNFSKPVRPSDSNRNASPALHVTAPPSPSVSNIAALHETPSRSPAIPTSLAAKTAGLHPYSEAAREEHMATDSLLVQKTYARIDEIGGIPRDGFVEGVELTRERRTQASISDYLDPILAASWGPSSSSDRLSEAPASTSRRKSEGASASLLSVNEARERRPSGTTDRSRKVSAASRAASTKAPQEEEAELQLLQKVDRYGFFTPTYLTTTSGRLVLLEKARCLELPKTSLKPNSKRKSQGHGSVKSASLQSPYINLPAGATHPSPNNTRNNSPRNSLQPPSSNAMSTSTSLSSLRSLSGAPLAQSVNGHKEPLRILKWYDEMLIPARRDAGGNVAAWKLSDSMLRNEAKLQRRIRKGIPDRWRLAAWEALALRMRDKTRKGPELASLERRFYVRSVHQIICHCDPVLTRIVMQELILEPCQHDVQIDLDVPRTISGHLYFHTRYGLG